MNKITKFFHEFFHPHCEHCADERRDESICNSCETLKIQLDIMTLERNKLLDKLLKEPEIVKPSEPVEVTRPINIPWNVRRQMLEKEDRAKAKLMREAPKPIEELEKELGIASESRKKESSH